MVVDWLLKETNRYEAARWAAFLMSFDVASVKTMANAAPPSIKHLFSIIVSGRRSNFSISG